MTDVAVVIACHDAGRTLGDAVASALAQTLPAAEVVVVDDGSRDPLTLRALAELDAPPLRVERTENRGLAAARNHGIRLTTASYLVMLDADDLLELTYLQEAAARLDADAGLAFVSCGVRAFGGGEHVWVPPLPDLAAMPATGAPHATSMFRRELWAAVGGFDETLPMLEDLDFWLGAQTRGFRGEVIAEPLLRYRVRLDSLHHRGVRSGEHQTVMRRVLAKHREALEARGPELLLAMQGALHARFAHERHLGAREREVEAEIAALRAAIADAGDELRRAGEEPMDFGDLRRLAPFSGRWGFERGLPIDRYYIERFLAAHREDVASRVLEVRDSHYTERFGGERVTDSQVIDIDAGSTRATIHADLARADAVPEARFDCILVTQTLHLIADVRAAIAQIHRILAPGGVALCTLPVVAPVQGGDGGLDGDLWRFTENSARAFFAEHFPAASVTVTPFGNTLAATAFLYGLAAGELATAELDQHDPSSPVLLGVRAVKAERPPRPRRYPPQGGAVLVYHRVAELQPDSNQLCTPPARFRAQMEHVRERYRPIGLGELARAAARGTVPPGAVAVTFDDGCLDALTTASPILVELGIPATFFVTTDSLAIPHEAWWDELERLLLDPAPSPPELVLDDDGETLRLSTAGAAQRADAWRELQARATAADLERRTRLLAALRRWRGIHIGTNLAPRESHRLLVADEVVELARRPGHTIGSHTRHHLKLPLLAAPARRAELVESKAALEALLGRPVPSFAYPYGSHDAATAADARAAGYELAVTVFPGLVLSGADPFILLPRLELGGTADFPTALYRAFAGAGAAAGTSGQAG